jgi:hypothetical protein
MADKHIYKKRLTPDKMKCAGTRALNLRFQASTTMQRCKTKLTSVAREAKDYSNMDYLEGQGCKWLSNTPIYIEGHFRKGPEQQREIS